MGILLLRKVCKISDDQTIAIEFEDQIDAWIDKGTGLMWEVKTKENIEYEYVWSEEWIKEAYEPEKLTDDVKDSFSYAKKLNEMNYAGFSDWRIPTIEELKTLQTEKRNNELYIKFSLSKNSSSDYWSSTTDEVYKYFGWDVYFDFRGVSLSYKNDNYYIRCVRAGQ